MYHIKFRLLSRVLGFALLAAGGLGLWAQEGVSPGDAVEAAGSRAPSEGEIFLGEETPGLSVAEPGPVSGFAIFRTVLLLILAAAAVYGVVFVVKKLSQPKDALNPNLRVLAAARLGPGRFVHVVALGSRAWLVGSGEGGISHIADVTEQEALDTLFLEESRQNGASGRTGDFQSLLRRLGVLKAPGGIPPGELSPGVGETREDLAGKIRLRRDRLRDL